MPTKVPYILALIALGAVAGWVSRRHYGVFRIEKNYVGNDRFEVEFVDGGEDVKWFECRAVGEGVTVGCKATAKESESHIYTIRSDPVPKSGGYRVFLTVAHVGARGGHPKAPEEISNQFLGVRYPPSPQIKVRRTKENRKKCLQHFSTDGATVKFEGCGTPFGIDLEKCISGRSLILLGDSHMRSWVNATVTAVTGKTFPVGKSPLTPLTFDGVSYIRTEAFIFTDKPNSSSIPEEYHTGWKHTEHQIKDLKTMLDKTPEAKVTVAMNFGAWDLRDITVEEYCSRGEKFFSKLNASGVYKAENAKFVWRTTTPYSYNGKKYRKTDYRTNEKIEDANACIASLLKKQPREWAVHDSFTMLRPFFLDSCDSHHYLCNPIDTRVKSFGCPWFDSKGNTVAVGCEGKADLSEFLHTHHCPDVKSKPLTGVFVKPVEHHPSVGHVSDPRVFLLAVPFMAVMLYTRWVPPETPHM